jgi:peptidoglycan/LPS O-acetylase OafA/YrhL
MPKPQEVPWISWLGSVTLTEEWRGNVIGPPKQYFSAHIWSLCYEEQFYLIAGLLVAFARRWLFLGFALTSLLVGLMLGAFDSVLPSRDGFFTDGNWLVFAAGLAVYYRVNYASLRTKLCLDGVLVLLAVWTARPLNHWAELHAGVMGNLLVGCLFALLLGWLHRWDAAISRARILLPLRYCGQMCYSLYLMHAIPTMLIAWNCYRLGITSPQATWLITVPLGVLVSVGAGRAFYLLVERRFLNAPIRDAKPDPSSTTDPSCKSTAGACGQLNPASTLASANSR